MVSPKGRRIGGQRLAPTPLVWQAGFWLPPRWLGGGICLREFVLVSEHLQRATLNGKVIGPTEAVLCHRVGWRKTSPDCGGSKHDQSLAKQHHITPQLSLHAQFRHRTPFPPALFPFPLPTCLP
jgi:hypothetical protein